MKHCNPSLAAVLLAVCSGLAFAQAPADDHDSHHPTTTPAASAPAGAQGGAAAQPQELSEGEITRWDPRTLKVTLRHGELKNLGMPPMTMVFRVKDAGMLAPFQVGDKVRFRAERQSAGYFITHIEAAR